MHYYRLYFLDATGHVIDVLPFECDDDDAAIALAKLRAGAQAMELWNQDRRIEVFPPKA